MMLIISPSKTQGFTFPCPPDNSLPRFRQETETLVNHLRRLDRREIAALMGISDKLADTTWQSFQNFSPTYTIKNSCPAILAFQGAAYDAIRAKEFSRDDFIFAQQNLRILSGLYGLLNPLDLIQPYRLEMKTKIPAAPVEDLYRFWHHKITDLLHLDMERGAHTHLVNLASQEYFKAVLPKTLNKPILDILFKVRKNHQYKVVALHAKRARGLMVRFVVKHRLKDINGLKEFQAEGYQFTADHSNDRQWVFRRE